MSGGAFLSPSWYRVAPLRPSLKSQANIRRHRFRGEIWYVIEDPASGRFNRFSPATYQLLGLMDGQTTMDDIWLEAIDQLGDDTPSQDEIISLLSQMHGADLLLCEVNPDTAELFERFGKQDKSRGRISIKNPFSIRIPLWDPDRFLDRTLFLVRPLKHWLGILLYCLVVGYAMLLVGVYWPDLTQNASDRLLSGQNLVLLWFCFPLVKLLHEMGHGYAAKAGGGEVHEMGIMFLVFMPIPYVDATCAHGFRSKWQRVLVGAAGMMTELFIASFFVLVWVAAEPGLVRAVAFNVIIIAGVSALIFNGNPLLRYDAYYILSDIIEMPNLATRGNQYWRYLFERHVFRMPDVEPPPSTPGERRWMAVYTPAALVYRTFVLVAIVFYIASEWFFFGVLLALFGGFMMLGMPIVKLVRYLSGLPRSAGTRQRAILFSSLTLVSVLVVLMLVPVPLRVGVEGVVWLPDEANVRAGTEGFVQDVLVQSGEQVTAGQALVVNRDSVLTTDLKFSRARLAELQVELNSQRFKDRVKAAITREEIEREQLRHDRLLEQVGQLIIRSPVNGRLELDRSENLPGRFYRQGDLVGYVIQDARKIVRIVVSQDDVDLVRNRVQSIQVRLRERVGSIYPATILRAVPAAKDYLPSAALSSAGGGAIAADPRDPASGKTLQRMFQFDLALPADVPIPNYGGRAYVRLELDPEPLAVQWGRRLRQLFLERFNV